VDRRRTGELLSTLVADSQKIPQHKLRLWLDRYRKRLVEKDSNEIAPAEVGSLDLGFRLDSSRAQGFDLLVYGKAPGSSTCSAKCFTNPPKNPDACFVALHTLQTKLYPYQALSTDNLQREIEAVMTTSMGIESRRSMDWFCRLGARNRHPALPHRIFQQALGKGYVIKVN
jgi:hypothetical protein